MTTKRWMIAVSVALLATGGAWADEKKKQMEMKPHKGSAELERVKSLAGKWAGRMDKMRMQLEYTVVAGGSAVMERAFPGTEMEMVTMYNDDRDGKLVMTHYCMLKNRPHLALTGSDERSISMSLVDGGEVDASKDSHMHSLILTFVSDEEIEQAWTHYDGGKEVSANTMKFKRVAKRKGKKDTPVGEAKKGSE